MVLIGKITENTGKDKNMKEQLEYLMSWSIVAICAIIILGTIALVGSIIQVKYDLWKQQNLAQANIERAVGIAKANQILGEKVIDIDYL